MPDIQAYFNRSNVLALYRQMEEHQEFWEHRWQSRSLQRVLERSRSGYLDEFEYPFVKYLPKGVPILEAGCGTGMYVCALQARGYTVEGLDYAAGTIACIREIDPSLDVRVGDVYAIDRQDDFYGGYISIGVFEHNFEGPEVGLVEAHRVLRPGGVALISVPYMNWPRRYRCAQAPQVSSIELGSGLRFYQDHYSVQTFSSQLKAAGFEIVQLYPYSLFGALVRDWAIGRWLQQRSFFHWRLARLSKRLCRMAPHWVHRDLSHMMMFICRKPSSAKI